MSKVGGAAKCNWRARLYEQFNSVKLVASSRQRVFSVLKSCYLWHQDELIPVNQVIESNHQTFTNSSRDQHQSCAVGFTRRTHMAHTTLKVLCFSLVVSSLHGIQASSQTNQQLLQERLITPAVYVLLKSRGANTPAKRWEVIQTACSAGRLSPNECGTSRRRREY